MQEEAKATGKPPPASKCSQGCQIREKQHWNNKSNIYNHDCRHIEHSFSVGKYSININNNFPIKIESEHNKKANLRNFTWSVCSSSIFYFVYVDVQASKTQWSCTCLSLHSAHVVSIKTSHTFPLWIKYQ